MRCRFTFKNTFNTKQVPEFHLIVELTLQYYFNFKFLSALDEGQKNFNPFSAYY